MQTYRALTFSEASFVRQLSREIIGTSFELRGRLDVDALHTAFGALLREIPVLAAQVVNVSGVPHFAPRNPATAAARGFHHEAASWHGYAQAPPSLLGSELLSALTLTGVEEHFRLTLWASHAALDGTGIVLASQRLFELYTECRTGGEPLVRPALDFPAEPHVVMASRGHLPSEVDYEGRLAGTRWHGSLSAAVETDLPDADDAGRVRFDPVATAALAETARAHGLSFHALVSGLIARAELAESPTGSALALLTPVDLRHRVEPPIPPLAVTALCGFSYTAVTDDSIVGLARLVSEQLRSDLRDGTVLRTAVSPMPDPATRRHGPPVLLSNIGQFPPLTLPAGLAVHDFHSQIVRSAAGIRAYASSWQEASPVPVPLGSAYLLSIFADRLSVEMRTLPGTLDDVVRARILHRIEADALALIRAESAA